MDEGQVNQKSAFVCVWGGGCAYNTVCAILCVCALCVCVCVSPHGCLAASKLKMQAKLRRVGLRSVSCDTLFH